ncbi:MAG: PKD domain-containing protein [Crocinitomicaceae bacterium]
MKKALFVILATLFTSFAFNQQTQIDFAPASDGQTFLTCNGFIIDSGGQGGPGYSNGESWEVTVCPDTITTGDPSLYITVTFNFFQLDGTNTGTQQNPNVDYMSVYDGTSSSAPTLGTYTTNGLQGVSIAATNLNPTGCLTFVFYSNSTGTGQFTASATCTTPCVPPTAAGFIVNGDTPDSIRVCVGDPVSFDGSGSFAAPGFSIAEYEWNFFDGNIDNTSGSTVTHAFNAPGQYQVQLKLTDDNTDNVCNNLNVIPLKVYVSNYPTFYEFPSDTTICLGESVTLEGITNFGQYDSTWTGFPQSNAVDDGCLPDTLLGISQTIPLTYAQFDPSATVTNINDIQSICLNMEHSYMGDLVIQLTCPNGTTINLQTQGGGGTQIGVPDQADNVDCPNQTGIGVGWDYCWDPNATQTWTDWVNAQAGWGLTLPSGTYASVDPLTDLIGCPLNGQWQITVIDNWAADDGTIFEFGVTFAPPFYPNIIQFTNTVGEGPDSSYWDMTDPWITGSDPDLNIIDVTPGAAGTFDYTYYCVNNFGCDFDSTITITVTDNPFADAGPDTSICGGGATSVQLQGGIGAGGSATCSYTLDLIDTFGDTWNGNTIDVTINGVTTNYTENNGSQTTITLPVSHGDQITLQWNATGNWQSENEFYLYDGNGTLIYSDGTNWSTPSTAPVSFTADCYGGITFAWTPTATLDDPASPTPNASPSASTDYVLMVYPTGHPLCFTTDTVTVDMGGASDAGIDGIAFLCSDNVPVDLFIYLGGTPQTTGTWQEAGTGNPVVMPFDPAIMPAGDYEYHVDSLGCTSFSTVTVTIDNPTATNVAVDSDCGACNGQVTLTGANGQGFYEYSIDNGLTFQSSDTFTALCPGDHYFVVRDSLGCTINDTATVNEINFPTISFSDTTGTDCGGANGTISVNTNLGTAPFQFGLVGGALQADSTIAGLATGTYDVLLIDNFGCSDTLFGVFVDSINIPAILNVVPTNVDCNSADNGSVDISGQHVTNFSINGGAFQANGVFNGLAPGNYTVLVENDFGCQDTASFSITEPSPLQLQITSLPIDSICMGESTTLSAAGSGGNGGPYTFDWYLEQQTLVKGFNCCNTECFLMLNYCAVISEACGSPTDSACTSVYIEPYVMPQFVVDRVDGCYPISVTFTNTTQGTVTTSNWNFGDGNGQSVAGTTSVVNTFDYEDIFSVYLEIITPEGCVYDTIYTDLIETYGYPNANFTFNPNPVSMYDPTVTFQDLSSGDNIISWNWGFPGGSPSSSSVQDPIVTYPEGEPGVYDAVLTVVNDHGCVDSASTQVRVINEVILYAPNAFTPDGDSHNDIWQVFIDGIDFYDFELIVFNRWGEKVWESHNPDVGWNGTYMGQIVQDGTYVWILKCKDQWNDKKYTFNGHLTIVR